MWIMSENGTLVNLDQVEHISIYELTTNEWGVLASYDENSVSLKTLATKAEAYQLIRDIAQWMLADGGKQSIPCFKVDPITEVPNDSASAAPDQAAVG